MKMRNTIWLVAVVMALLVSVSLAGATVVTLPNTGQGSSLAATVSEQANVSVSSAIAFAVTDVTSTTANTSDASVSATVIVLTNGNALKIELTGDEETFTPPASGGTTWDVEDISWDAATWTNGTGNAASLSATGGTYVEVASSTANAASCASTDLTFTLAAKAAASPAVKAGDHTLAATWKFSSYTP